MQYYLIIAASELAEGRGLAVDIEGRAIVVFRQGEAVFALDNLCPHSGARLERGRLIGNAVECPMHGAKFELATGHCRTRHVPEGQRIVTHHARIADGWVQVALAEEPMAQPVA